MMNHFTFYISSPADYIKNFVIRTKERVIFDERNISMNRLYTSVEIANWLVEKNMIVVGTVQKGRVGFPGEVFHPKNCEVLSKTCSFFIYKGSKDKKNVLILSTTRPMHSCTKDDKHQIFKFYDFTKGGTDTVDQMNDYFTPEHNL